MKQSAFYILWAGLFGLCAALGFIPEPEGLLKWLLVAASVLFFLPPLWLYRTAAREKDFTALKLLRSLSIASLSVTVMVLIVNILSVFFSETVGKLLYSVLVVVSTPMICSQYWVLSLFLWACLMVASGRQLKKA